MQKTLIQRIQTIKSIKDTHGLSRNNILDIISEHGKYVSPRSLDNILADGSEHKKFQYSTIAEVYEPLVDVYGDEILSDDISALKHIIKERNKQIDTLYIDKEELKEEFAQRLRFYEDRKTAYENTISMLKAQIDKQNEQIERKDEMLMRLLDKFISNVK